jgi:hypothetical protein
LKIPLNVPSNFGDPIRGVVPSAEPRKATFEVTPMPEVAIAEHCDARLLEHDVGAAR